MTVAVKTCPSCNEGYDADVLFCPRDGTPLVNARTSKGQAVERDPYLGMELPGQIRLEHLIGIGSMGRVYRAFQGGIERHVAVKVLHRELSGNHELVGRFHREAKVASRLFHPNVVQVLMTGALPHSPDPCVGGELYLVMEYLDGISLLSALAAMGAEEGSNALPLPRALHIALQICDAVGEAHAQGIVHRDLKPENVMLVRRGEDRDYVKVLDFGIARLSWADRGMATQAGLIFGTAKYISPEGAEGRTVEPPADVYSIATVLYQMLAGRAPFEGDSPVALLVQHTHAPPPDLRGIARASYVPAPIASLIMQNLSKRPADRSENARAFGRDLVAAVRASGLFPEEIVVSSTIFSPASHGAVKLASRERTRNHELSAELAAKIGGVPASERPRDRLHSEIPFSPTPTRPTGLVHPAASMQMALDNTARPADVVPVASPSFPAILDDELPDDSQPRPALGPGTTVIDHESLSAPAVGPGLTVPGAPGLYSSPTIHGTETELLDPPYVPVQPRARAVRIVAALACAIILVPILVLGGRRAGLGGASATESIDAVLTEARDAERRHAWDSPPGHNFKEITERGLARFPTQTTALWDLRKEAAPHVVADALGRKYENDIHEAKRLAKLALELDPSLTTAQHLVQELDKPPSPDAAPPDSATARGPERPPVKPPKRLFPAGDARSARVPTPRPSTSAAGSPAVPPPTEAVLPAPPRPASTPNAEPSAPGPWL